jgi:hypothetical protein
MNSFLKTTKSSLLCDHYKLKNRLFLVAMKVWNLNKKPEKLS